VPVEFVEILAEEPSAEAALRLLVPKILNQCAFEVYPHNGKADLLRKLPGLFAGYRIRRRNDPWFRNCCRAAVLVDRDQQDCRSLKQKMESAAKAAGLATRSQSGNHEYFVVNRIAVEELEAWFFGDWDAVRAANPKVAATVPSQARFGWRGPQRGYAARPAYAHAGLGPHRPKPALRFAGATPAFLPGGGPPSRISQPFAPILPTVQSGATPANRRPDAIANPWEALERVLKGYFPGGLRKIEAARAIATHMDPERNPSPSFCAFRDILKEMASL